MSYKCGFCGITVFSTQHKAVIKTRKVAYIRTVKNLERNEKERKVSYGWEIAKEKNICSKCETPEPIVEELEKIVDCGELICKKTIKD